MSNSGGIDRMSIKYMTGDSAGREERHEYTEEEEFAIMYWKIVLGMEWRTITNRMNIRYPQKSRSAGGLSSKYYRIREKWGLSGARVSGEEKSPEDVSKVLERAREFDDELIRSLN
ncbi:hypothetical protein EV356DRAFT_34590 [Viridothelium virens]|uniref:Myb-like domain-containing protein n=1 Tax=Viridothelium virens TaxID=1048519 RepID=A0A6A6GTS8_VIRVR|nr:hypothetical protein EV356DRAFT_34590 [Viridothelium virens]